MKIAGVHHVSLNVRDTEEAGRFYRDVLGLEQIQRPAFGFPGMWLRSGPQEIHLLEVADHHAPDGQHFAFRVEDIDGVVAEIRRRGAEVSDPFPVPGGGRQAFLKDPSGNLIELNQSSP
jgi:catechol 2,3-dioxygenase-like lactoylglutathione lyase family enzyme